MSQSNRTNSEEVSVHSDKFWCGIHIMSISPTIAFPFATMLIDPSKKKKRNWEDCCVGQASELIRKHT